MNKRTNHFANFKVRPALKANCEADPIRVGEEVSRALLTDQHLEARSPS